MILSPDLHFQLWRPYLSLHLNPIVVPRVTRYFELSSTSHTRHRQYPQHPIAIKLLSWIL